jgi:hypothetical protein
MFDFRHCGLHDCIYRCIYGGIDGCITGENSSTELLHFLLGLEENRLQGVEARLVGYVLYSLHVCVCGCIRYDNCV